MTNGNYDVVIIGGGPGGYVAAIRAAQRGARVALVEKDRLGGTCLNRGCIPTKALIHDAALFRRVALGQYGIKAEGALTVDMHRLMARKRQVVETLVAGVARLMDSYGIEVIQGNGQLLAPERVRVQGVDGPRELTAKAVILATGSVPAEVPIPGVDLGGVMTSNELLEIESLPASMVVIGGSVVGVEFACMFAALGAQVTIVGRKSFLRDADAQLAKRMQSVLRRQGINIIIGVDFREITRNSAGHLAVQYVRQGVLERAEAEVVLVATGRRPYTKGLGLEHLGVRMDGAAIAVDEHLETSLPGVYAIGDCTGGLMLAHVAFYEAEVAVDNALGASRVVDHSVVPIAIFTMPEIAGVGLTEAQAKERGIPFRMSRFPFAVNGRAVAIGETEGQVRMLCEQTPDGHSGKVLGVHIMGPNAGDLIAEAALALRLGATAADIAHTIHAHPTLPEALMEAAMGHLQGAIHYEHR